MTDAPAPTPDALREAFAQADETMLGVVVNRETEFQRYMAAIDAAGFAVVPKEPTRHMMQMVNDGPLCAGEHLPDWVWLRAMYLGYLAAGAVKP